jgi:hypothetical protein
MRPTLAATLRPYDVVHVHGGYQLVTGVRTWRGVVTATLLGMPAHSWQATDSVIVAATAAEPSSLTRGEGQNNHDGHHHSTA